MNTKITQLLGIKHPIVQGGMAWVSDAILAAAVSNAGGAGIIGAGGHDAEWVSEQIYKARELTDKSFGINVVLTAEDKEEIIEVICKLKPKFVTFGAGNPIPYLQKFKDIGIITIPVVPSLRLAMKVEEAGADAIVIEGLEAGGHIGKQTTMSLMTNVIINVNIPVIVAGGIADYRGVKAALAMGAEGVQMGSRFLLSEECLAHINVKKKIIESTDTDSVILGYTINHSIRGIRNKMSDEYLAIEYSEAPRNALKGRMKNILEKSMIDGDVENGFVEVGQSLNVLNKILSCKEIINEIMSKI